MEWTVHRDIPKKKKSNSLLMLQQLFLFLADYTVICAQSFHMTVATDTLSGNLMDGNFGCCPALVRLLFKCTHELLISMNKLA